MLLFGRGPDFEICSVVSGLSEKLLNRKIGGWFAVSDPLICVNVGNDLVDSNSDMFTF